VLWSTESLDVSNVVDNYQGVDKVSSNPNDVLVNGIRVPEGCIPAWTLDESEKNRLVDDRRPLNYNPSTYFQPIEHMGEDIIVGYLGHVESRGRAGTAKFHHEVYRQSYTYFIDYAEGKPVYVTFDQVTVHRLLQIQPRAGEPLLWYWKRIDSPKKINSRHIFMVMPFEEGPLQEFYTVNVRDFLTQEMGLIVQRADSVHDNDVISDTVLQLIEESAIIIADSSTANKNVFYEIGYADAKGKELILMQNRSAGSIFFDKAHRRGILYDMDKPEQFREELLATVKHIQNRVGQNN